MPATRHPTIETVDFGNSKAVDVFLDQVMDHGLRRIQAESADLKAKGLADSDGNILVSGLPVDMREGSERDFGG